jgi:hypothetical protein
LLPVPESMYPWVMMVLMALLMAPVEVAFLCSHSGRYHRVALQTRGEGPSARNVHTTHAARAKRLHRL